MNPRHLLAGLAFPLLLAACAAPGAPGAGAVDQNGQIQACRAQAAERLNVPASDLSVASQETLADGSLSLAFTSVQQFSATCTVDSSGNVTSVGLS